MGDDWSERSAPSASPSRVSMGYFGRQATETSCATKGRRLGEFFAPLLLRFQGLLSGGFTDCLSV